MMFKSKVEEAAYFNSKTINEKQEFVSKAGAGEWGRPELVNKYKKDTPGQNIASFKDYLKTK